VRSSGGTEHFSGEMGSGQIVGGGNGGSCCDMSVKCSCRWRLENQQYYKRLFSSGFVFFFGCFVLFGSIATLYGWLAFSPTVHTSLSSFGCRDDNEGSWSVGVFYGDSPFSLKPIEAVSFFLRLVFMCMFVSISPFKLSFLKRKIRKKMIFFFVVWECFFFFFFKVVGVLVLFWCGELF